MGLLRWIRNLFEPARSASDRPRRDAPHRSHASTAAEPAPALPTKARDPAAYTRVGNLDRAEHVAVVLEGPSEELLWRLGQRIERGDFEVPRLPPTSLLALEMTNRPSVDISQLVDAIERDPLLTSEMLKIANSALYATNNPASTLQQAIMRLGLRSVRGVVFTAAMKSSILNSRGLIEYSEEVWRQAQSVARIARAIAPKLNFDPDQAYVIGLLHDIGKVALLGLLQREISSPSDASPVVVGRTFHTFHELAGLAMAHEWRLPDDLVSIAGRHHDFRSNSEQPRGAALAFLAHRLDLHMSLDDEAGVRELVHSDVFDALNVKGDVRLAVIAEARRAWSEIEESVAHR